ncbi:MAG: UvrB/UvrC motif-containing protein [Planctomycetota bacterium]
MDPDLTELLEGWPYEPGRINVRLIERADGERRLQVRLDLGVLQMELDGRPDGHRPHGFESLLDVYEAGLNGEIDLVSLEDSELAEAAASEAADEPADAEEPAETDQPVSEEEAPGDGPLGPPRASENGSPREAGNSSLSSEQVSALRDEAIQYYHRYLALLAIEEFERVIRDTTRNLRALDMIAEHAEEEEDRLSVNPTRAHVTMMRARALMSLALRESEPKAAIAAIDEGLDALRKHFESTGHSDLFERSSEVQVLQGMKKALMPKLPVSQKAELSRRLDDAVASENYRLAAILRDELNSMPE